jgi:CRP-like cAMP-binding protein
MVTLEMFRNVPAGREFLAGERIFDAGDIGDRMFVVLRGTVRLSVRGRVLELLGPGQAFGELALIDDGPRAADAVAVTDVELVEINEERFRNLVRGYPGFSLQVMRVLADRLRHVRDRIAA